MENLINILFLLVLLVGMIVSIVGFNWYKNHGGAKKWMEWLSFLPLIAAFIIVLAFSIKAMAMGLGNSTINAAGYAVMHITSTFEMILNIATFISFCILTLNSIISPIISFRWYVKHGGTKKWLELPSYLLAFSALIIVSYMFIRVNF